MKMIWFIFVAAMLSLSASAADIVLKDGRVLKDATIRSQAPRTVTIMHAGGLSSVAKTLLPAELQTQYPVDEPAAIEADRKASIAREKAQEYQKSESERVARLREDREKAVAESAATQANEAYHQEAKARAVKSNAKFLAEQYFEKRYAMGSTGATTSEVTITDVRPVEGWFGRWLVNGSVIIRHYESDNQNRTNSESTRNYTVETQNFEGHYSTEGTTPTIDITLR